MVDVIVQYKSFAGAQTRKRVALGRIHRHFRSIPATHMTVPVSMIAKPGIEPAGGLHLAEPEDLQSAGHHHADRQRESALWSEGWDGTGVGVAVIDSGVALKRDLGCERRLAFARRLQRELRRWPGCFGSIWTWHARGGHRGRERSAIHRAEFHAHLQGRGAEREYREPARAGCQRQRAGIGRDRGHRRSHRAEGQIQHSRHQSFAGTSGLRKLPAGSAVPGRGGGLEGRHHGGGGRWKYGPRQLARHARATRPSIRRATIRTSSPSAP